MEERFYIKIFRRGKHCGYIESRTSYIITDDKSKAYIGTKDECTETMLDSWIKRMEELEYKLEKVNDKNDRTI